MLRMALLLSLGSRVSPACAFVASRHPTAPQLLLRLASSSTVSETMSEDDVKASLREVSAKVDAAVAARGGDEGATLVVVSKTKPVSLLRAAYDSGARHFGENYLQELADKVGIKTKHGGRGCA